MKWAVMKRDKRLLIAMLLFATSLLACAFQVWVTALYVQAAVMGNWKWFAETFAVDAPASGPNSFCFDYCAADYPFLVGWVGLICFFVAWVLLAYAWWKPRA